MWVWFNSNFQTISLIKSKVNKSPLIEIIKDYIPINSMTIIKIVRKRTPSNFILKFFKIVFKWIN